MSRSRLLIFLLVLLGFSSCKSKRKLVEEPMAGWDGRKGSLEALWETHRFQPNFFSFKASAAMEQNGSRTSFQLEMRMRKDSLIWLNFSDPILGIPIVRAILLPDSFAMYNKLEKTYKTGDATAIREMLGLEVPFDALQAALLANLPVQFSLDSASALSQTVLALYPHRVTINSELQLVDPLMVAKAWRPSSFGVGWTKSTDRLVVKYEGYQEMAVGLLYPNHWQMDLLSNTPTQLLVDVQEADIKPLRFPFSIPPSYRKTP